MGARWTVVTLAAAAALAGTNIAVDQHVVRTATAPANFRLALPAPTGPLAIGTAVLHVTQPNRPDPWRGGRPREVMVQLWYPAGAGGGTTPAPYLGARAAAQMAHRYGFPTSALSGVRTHAVAGAPLATAAGGLPVLLFSPGDGGNRGDNSALTEDLASHGYLVAALDHLGDGLEAQLPDGSLVPRSKPESADDVPNQVEVRVGDLRAALDALTALDHGGTGDANLRVDDALATGGLTGALNLDRVGAFGHSLGGNTAAQAMAEDPRLCAGADLDGLVVGPVGTAGLDRPLLVLRSPWHTPDRDPSWKTFLPALRGWHRVIALRESGHYSFADLGLWAKPARIDAQTSNQEWRTNFGDLPGTRATALTRACLLGFFDGELRGAALPAFLDRPTPGYPELSYSF